MSFRSFLRDQAWRNAAKENLLKRRMSYDSDHSQIIVVDFPRDLNVDDTSSELASPEQLTSKYLILSSPITTGPRVTTRAAASCAPPSHPSHYKSYSDSEADPTASSAEYRRVS